MAILKRLFRWNPRPAKGALVLAGATVAQRAAEFMAGRAQHHVPVDTGFLHNSIVVIHASGSSSWRVVATADYAQWVEFGHVAHSTWVAPNPFMRRALADTRAAFPSFADGVRVDGPGIGNSISHVGASFG